MTASSDNILLTIPNAYNNVYEALLIKLAETGLCLCEYHYRVEDERIYTCWNIFQSACASYVIGDTQTADILIKYIVKELNLLEEDSNPENPDIPDNPEVLYTIVYYGVGEMPEKESDLISHFSKEIPISSNEISITFNPKAKKVWIANTINKKLYSVVSHNNGLFNKEEYNSQYIIENNIDYNNSNYNIELFDFGKYNIDMDVTFKLK